ncbi:hypothetical protein PL321_11925 [Caloramator sp. mosi_1]|uniref:hypothetical protein n=1 Tax=Caloramator sp. mosi_1 TaxID=3023090 RepID=UPI00236193CB|nr:hypothetical protein [Caloramator sp. mosi_1]WDC83440.1 hypothetical protein PL321_11925 [Caloramator sp. mosi_1]
MKGAVVYFSGTGNTEFVAKLFEKELKEKGYEITLIDVCKKQTLMITTLLCIWMCYTRRNVSRCIYELDKKNIKQGSKRRCIIFSTQASNKAAGASLLADELEDKGFDVRVVEFITMPNNYYLVGFGKDSQHKKIC